MPKHFLFFALVAVVGIFATACGPAATPPPATPVEGQVTLSEFTVELSQTTIPVGTIVRFVITNAGTLAHNFVIERQGAVDEPLVADGERANVEEENLPPGASLTFEWTFTEAGDFQIACHVPGHYEAGMVSPIVVQ